MDAEDLDLRKETFEIADLVFQDSTMEFDISIPASVTVQADPIRLRQVLRNLLENALKYGGDQVLVDGEPSGKHFRMVVTDNGPGVPVSDRERIFDHFEQLTKGDSRVSQGVGLGLPIARKLVRAMGGDLWFEPRFPTGSRSVSRSQWQIPSSPHRRPWEGRRDVGQDFGVVESRESWVVSHSSGAMSHNFLLGSWPHRFLCRQWLRDR